MLRTAAVDQLGLRVEPLAPDAVRALVPAAVEVAVRRRRAPQPLDTGPVTGVAAGADEVVEGDAERVAQRFERGRVRVDEVLRGHARGLGAEHVLERVVVGAAEEAHVAAGGAPVPGQDVGLHQLERVPHVRARVHVRDRNGDVGASHRTSSFSHKDRRLDVEAPDSRDLGTYYVLTRAERPMKGRIITTAKRAERMAVLYPPVHSAGSK